MFGQFEVVSRGDFQNWLKTTKPEVVIEGGQHLTNWFPPGSKIAHVTLGWRADHPRVAGIDQQAAVLGAAAVDLLVAQHQHNERGIPPNPKMLMTEGVWRPARS